MKRSIFSPALVAGVLLPCLCIHSPAQYLDQIGVTLLRATTTNLDGSGIWVAQPEATDAGATNFEVNPSAVSQPAALFKYVSAAGTATSYPNSVGTESGHADNVGAHFYGLPGGVATNLSHVDNSDANYYVQLNFTVIGPTTNWTCSLPGADSRDVVVNQSFIFGAVPSQVPVAAQQAIDKAYDNYAAANGILFVSGAGNSGGVCPPSTCYNGLSVAAFGGSSSVGPTADNGRCKPDITAPEGATSFSTPQVSGAAALLIQAAWRGDGGGDTNAAANIRTIKALLLNGAIKPANWTASAASPLDTRYGAGVLNVFNSYQQLTGRKNNYMETIPVSAGNPHPPGGALGSVSAPSGWDFNTNVSSATEDVVNHYYFNATNSPGGCAVTATLVWNRQRNQSSINNLDLFLYNCASSNLVACSTSLVDNVEHIFVPQLAPGRYDLQVWKAGGSLPNIVSYAEPYALAWAFTSMELNIAVDGVNTALTWPSYPDGFKVEAATNLIAVAWSPNQIPASSFTNGQNILYLNATNPAQFFRLRQFP